jgi:sigma-B regulation protein RsbU (phosphoserine phosphatase)
MIAKSVFYRNFFMHKELRLGKIVENANIELTGEIGNTDKFLTGIILRFEDDCIEYVNAGHPDMMLRKKESTQIKIINPSDNNFKGSILGVKEMSFPYKSAKIKAESGDLFAIFSDGIIEASGPDNSRFGVNGIARAMINSSRESAGETLDKIIEDFYDFTGTEKLTDDVTIIIIKRK